MYIKNKIYLLAIFSLFNFKVYAQKYFGYFEMHSTYETVVKNLKRDNQNFQTLYYEGDDRQKYIKLPSFSIDEINIGEMWLLFDSEDRLAYISGLSLMSDDVVLKALKKKYGMFKDKGESSYVDNVYKGHDNGNFIIFYHGDHYGYNGVDEYHNYVFPYKPLTTYRISVITFANQNRLDKIKKIRKKITTDKARKVKNSF